MTRQDVMAAGRAVRRLFFVALLGGILLAARPLLAATVRSGAEVLLADGCRAVAGKRVGLVTNQTGVVDGRPLAAALADCGVTVAALFAPEHGLSGTAEDGVRLADSRNHGWQVPVYSLYGKVTAPTPAMLAGLEALIFDLQDVGVRFYTFSSTLGEVMAAAAQAGLPLLVLDRPNPLGGAYVAGFVLDPAWRSFTAPYPVPVAHGLTMGELALMIKGEGWRPGLERLQLQVVPMQGWQRQQRWPETGRSWVAPSPNLPEVTSALLYAGVGLFEGTRASEGRGSRQPFQLVGHPQLPAAEVIRSLEGRHLPGVRFTTGRFTPRRIPGMSSAPKFRDREIPALFLTVTDPARLQPVETGVHLLAEVYRSLPVAARRDFFKRRGMAELAGSERLQQLLEAGASAETVIAAWRDEVARFREARRRYLLY